MKDKPSYILDDGEVRELDENFFKNAKRGRPALPKEQRKRRVNLMLEPEVIEALQLEGNMSAKANEILRKGLDL